MADLLSPEELEVLQGLRSAELLAASERGARLDEPRSPADDGPALAMRSDSITAWSPQSAPEAPGLQQGETYPFHELADLHRRFSLALGDKLSELLRSAVEVKVTALGELPASEFLASLETPTCLNVLRLGADDARLLIDVSPRILYPIIDCLLGGGREPSVPIDRPMSQIERRLAERACRLLMQEYREVWQLPAAVETNLERVESDPREGAIVLPREIVVVISLELKLRQARGTIKFCLPRPALNLLANQDRNSLSGSGSAGLSAGTGDGLGERSKGGPVTLIAQLAATTISADELRALRAGDLVLTDALVQDGISLLADGVVRFRARPGASDGHKAARIEG